jgi:alginate O-acetyltransferase complex protein AlgI
VSIPRWYFNLFFVFLVSGFWHGANWTFIVWGALHGFYLIFAIVSEKTRLKINTVLGITRVPWLYTLSQILVTYCLVTFAWVFFRANNIHEALYIAGQIPLAVRDILLLPFAANKSELIGFVPVYSIDIILSFILIAFMEGIHLWQRKQALIPLLKTKPVYVRWAVYYFFIITIVFLGVYENRQFIYFQF